VVKKGISARMSIVEVEEGRSSRCGKTTKGIAQDETGMSY